MKIKFLKIASVLCVMLFAASAGGDRAAAKDLKEIKLTYVQAPLNVPSIVERKLGVLSSLYEKYGIAVQYANLTSGPQQTAALASEDLQILNAVGASSLIIAASNNVDIKVISMYSRSPRAFMIFSNDASINDPIGLKGKTVAGPKGTNLNELLSAYLKKAGLSVKDVNFVNMSIPAAQAALESGAVDAALLAGPAAYNCMKSGKHLVVNGEGLISALIVTATSQKFYDEHTDLVETFLTGQKQVLDYMKQHPDETLRMTADATHLTPEAVKEMIKMYDFSSEVSEKDLADFKNTAKFLLESGMIQKEIDIEELMLRR
jgi:sulfonate transport system substrate-binding protein